MALWGGLFVAANMDLMDLHIYGDSALIVGGIMGHSQIHIPSLQGWISRVRRIWQRLGSPPIEHIYRDLNSRADSLSKQGLNAAYGVIQILHFQDGVLQLENSIPLP